MSRQKQLKIIISGGGTGGHIFPAIAIANALKTMQPETEILFIGARDRMEMEKVPKAGFPIKGLWISGWQRKFSLKNLLVPVKVLYSLLKSFFIISRFKPHAVIGVGGYSSGPVLYVAAKKGIPTLIQEQNSYAGITNRILGRSVEKVCLAYERAKKYFPVAKTVLTGNPVRQDILNKRIDQKKAFQYFSLVPDKKTLLIVGGSLGAKTINQAVRAQLDQVKDQKEIQLLWQTGELYYQEMHESVRQAGMDNVKVQAFIDHMEYAYAIADTVISRAGAIAISELCLVEKPIILVPSPNVAEDHQTKNAMALVDKGAAKIVTDQEAIEKLIPSAFELLNNTAEQQKLKNNIKKFAIKDADERIAEEVLKLVKTRNK